MEEYKLFDAEYRLMELVWNLEPVNSTALARRCEAELGWKKSTVFNLIRKLAGRGFLKNEHATVTAREKKLSPQEADELRRMLDESEGGRD